MRVHLVIPQSIVSIRAIAHLESKFVHFVPRAIAEVAEGTDLAVCENLHLSNEQDWDIRTQYCLVLLGGTFVHI